MSLQSLCFRTQRVTPISYRPKTDSFTLNRGYVGLCQHKIISTVSQRADRYALEGCATNGALVFCMRHQKKVPKLNKPADQRRALIRGLVTQVLRHGKIKTTVTRAKAIRKHVDHMITLAKNGSDHARRQAQKFIYDQKLVDNIFDSVGQRYETRNGGYCRVTREMKGRRGDNAEMATIELVD
eukprot:TRINITY_DN3553_c1_g1_i1.p2 TRINITY_DN3553_c1_g1~~TRINITY_DN3553_c1_g1_i1.p2  ORF type:complete len:183 (-),score=5.03 TRINITY_DN3553_c1_g1_i1:275-823(-)